LKPPQQNPRGKEKITENELDGVNTRARFVYTRRRQVGGRTITKNLEFSMVRI